jgi:hypothetical protein
MLEVFQHQRTALISLFFRASQGAYAAFSMFFSSSFRLVLNGVSN